MEEEIKNKLNKLYKKITNKSIEWDLIDKEKYLNQMNFILKSNPIFYKLCKKYGLEDVSLNMEKINEKYIYIYIFFDKLWEEIKDSDELKDKIFRIKFPIVKDRIFVNIKRFTLDWGYKLYEKLVEIGFNGITYRDFMFNLGISINIFEAIITDLIHLEFKNPLVGFILILKLPFLNRYTGINKRYINSDWLNLYTSWNYNFIYNNGPSKDCFPIAGICLINSAKHIKDDLWIDNRLYTLYLTTILATDNLLLMDKKINKKVLNDWNNLNLKYMKKIL
jgi:hypothetical protein